MSDLSVHVLAHATTFFLNNKTPVSHKVIEKRRRDRINRCLNELGKTVPMALAKQPVFGSRYESAFTLPEPGDFLCQLRPPPECHQNPSEPVFQQSHSGHLSWHGSALSYPQQHGLDHHHYVNFMSHSHSLHTTPHAAL
ncbi:Hairy and enhancer of split-related protein helt [Bagarius yarrelli]|uniref:Hairy and enhancer of split-related protein helt n=1 Tax=Bagarius yarrelli TaxID=175774 RepID=A0A556U8E4_BAGYA|nr:Hairy and enhancer of split-related protein helt [Bagarius yarrelli]